MAVEAVVSVVIQKLTHLLVQEYNAFDKVIDEVEGMRINLREMQSILKDAERQEGSDDELNRWIADFLRIVYQVEYAIETFALQTTRVRRMGFVKKFGLIIKNEFTYFRKVPDGMNYTKNIDRLKKEMDKGREKLDDCKRNKPHLESAGFLYRSSSVAVGQPPMQRWQETYSYYAEEEEKINFVFKKDVKTLVNQLTNSSQPLQILSIFGERGSGKTTAAKTIYNKTKDHFQCRAWLSVPGVSTTRSLLLVILRQVSRLKDEEKMTSDNLRDRLHNFLKGKTYLIVIDDIETGKCFQELRAVFPNMHNGSRVMFTTSDKDVASFADPWRRFNFKPLDAEDGWKLFLKKVPASICNQFPHHVLLDLKDEIVEKCKGLPLRIMMLAGLLSTRRLNSGEWWKVLEKLGSQLPRSIAPCSDILTFCYNDLPLHLKPCFLYLGMFPKGYEIPVRRLFRLWLAEGFVKQFPGMIPEDLVEGYLEELVNRNMVEISKRRSDERPKRCRMLRILHEIFLSKAVDIGLFHIHRNSNNNSETPPQFGIRRLVDYADIKGILSSENYDKDVRSYISFNNQKKDMPAEEIGNFLEKIIGTRGFGLLRVLDLENVYKPRLSEQLGNLFHLRYLGLRWTFLDTLPSSVGNLPYLETLDIKHTYISTLPGSVWKMKHLRHLCLNETRLDNSSQRPHRSPLAQLQTLWGLFVDEKSARKIGLNRLTNIRTLGLTSQPTSFEELGTWISTLATLQSLRLRSKDKMGQPSKLLIKPFSALENLTQLYLLGNLANQPAWYKFPPGLKVLTLSVSELKKDPMPTLAQLPGLIVLRLLAASYTGQEMDCPRQGFPTLRVLKLWKLNNLEKWTVQDGAMQNLCTLEIRCCSKLKELPESLLRAATFEKLILTNMPVTFVAATRKKKQKHTDIVENNWE